MELVRDLLVTLFVVRPMPLWNRHLTGLARAEGTVAITQNAVGARTRDTSDEPSIMTIRDRVVPAQVPTNKPAPTDTIAYPLQNSGMHTRANTTPLMHT